MMANNHKRRRTCHGHVDTGQNSKRRTLVPFFRRNKGGSDVYLRTASQSRREVEILFGFVQMLCARQETRTPCERPGKNRVRAARKFTLCQLLCQRERRTNPVKFDKELRSAEDGYLSLDFLVDYRCRGL